MCLRLAGIFFDDGVERRLFSFEVADERRVRLDDDALRLAVVDRFALLAPRMELRTHIRNRLIHRIIRFSEGN